MEARIERGRFHPSSTWDEGTWQNSKGYRSSLVRARLAWVASAGLAVVHIVAAVLSFVMLDMVSRQLTDAELNEAVSIGETIDALHLLVPLGNTVFFVALMAWLSRATDNVPHLAGGTPRIPPRWTVIWWFVPFANWFMVFGAFNDLARRMAKGIGSYRPAVLLTWWVAFWIARTLFVVLVNSRIQSLDELRGYLSLSVVDGVLGAATAIGSAVVVFVIQRWADHRSRLIASGEIAPRPSRPAPASVPLPSPAYPDSPVDEPPSSP